MGSHTGASEVILGTCDVPFLEELGCLAGKDAALGARTSFFFFFS